MDSVDLDPGAHYLLLSFLPIGELWPLRLKRRLIHLRPMVLPHCEGGDIRETWDRGAQIMRILVPASLRVVLQGVILLLVVL